MVLRPSDNRWRAVLVSVIAGAFLANAACTLVGERSETRRQVIRDAQTFAELTKARLCTTYSASSRSASGRYRNFVYELMAVNQGIERIRIVDVEGRVVADSSEDRVPVASTDPRDLRPSFAGERLAEVRGRDSRIRETEGGRSLEIVSPHIEDWGRHVLTVVYDVGVAAQVDRSARAAAWRTLPPAVLFALVTSLVLLALLRRLG